MSCSPAVSDGTSCKAVCACRISGACATAARTAKSFRALLLRQTPAITRAATHSSSCKKGGFKTARHGSIAAVLCSMYRAIGGVCEADHEYGSLVLRSAAEENGVSMLRKGGHRPRDARAFLSVCGLTVTSQKATTKEHVTHTKERTPVVHLTLAYLTHSDRVTEVARGANAQPGRSPKTNRDRRRRLRKHRRSLRVAAIVNDASFLFCGRTGFGGFEFSLFKR